MSASDILAGKAYIEITAKDSTNKGLAGARDRLMQMKSLVGVLNSLFMTLGSAIVAVMAASVKRMTEFNDTLGDMAERLGISARTLAEFRYAADRSESSLDDFEKAIRAMASAIQSLREHSKSMTATFRELGLSVEDFVGKSPDEEFALIAKRLAEVNNQTKKMDIARTIFGRAGAAMLPMMAHLEQLREQARAKGLIPSEQAIKAAGEIDDAMKDVRESINATTIEIGGAFAPAAIEGLGIIQRIARAGRQWTEQNTATIRSFGNLGVVMLASGIAISSISKSAVTLSNSMKAFGTIGSSAVAAVRLPLRVMSTAFAPIASSINNTRSMLVRLGGSAVSALVPLQRLASQLAGVGLAAGGNVGTMLSGFGRIAQGFAQIGASAGSQLARGIANSVGRAGTVLAPLANAISSAAGRGLRQIASNAPRELAMVRGAFDAVFGPLWSRFGADFRRAVMQAAIVGTPAINAIAAAYSRITPVASAAFAQIATIGRTTATAIASALVSSMTSAFARIRALGTGTFTALRAGVGSFSSGLSGVAGGAGGLLSMFARGGGGMIGQLASAVPMVLALGGGLASLVGPATLAIAAISAGVWAFSQFSDTGRQALAHVASFLTPFRATFDHTFRGIRDAMQAGDLAAAGRIGMAGLKLSLMQGVNAIAGAVGGAFGDFIANVGGKLAGGDFKGAWENAISGMGAVWDGFIAGLTDTFGDATKWIIDRWRGAVSFITDSFFALAKRFPKFGDAVLGIDTKGEQGRAEGSRADQLLSHQRGLARAQADLAAAKASGGTLVDPETGASRSVEDLEKIIAERERRLAQLGAESPDIFGDMAGASRQHNDYKARSAKQWIDDARNRADASKAQLGADNAGARGGLDDSIKRAQDELDELQRQAAAARAKAEQEDQRYRYSNTIRSACSRSYLRWPLYGLHGGFYDGIGPRAIHVRARRADVADSPLASDQGGTGRCQLGHPAPPPASGAAHPSDREARPRC